MRAMYISAHTRLPGHSLEPANLSGLFRGATHLIPMQLLSPRWKGTKYLAFRAWSGLDSSHFSASKVYGSWKKLGSNIRSERVIPTGVLLQLVKDHDPERKKKREREHTFAGTTQSWYVRHSPGACSTALEVMSRAEIRRDSFMTAVWDKFARISNQILKAIDMS